MSSKLQLDVRHLNRWWRHLVNAYEVRQAWCLLQVKLCDPCLSTLKWFVYHARRYTSAQLYFTLLCCVLSGTVGSIVMLLTYIIRMFRIENKYKHMLINPHTMTAYILYD